MKFAGFAMMLIGIAQFALAGANVAAVPEIDPTAAVGALTLLSGAFLVIRGRRRK